MTFDDITDDGRRWAVRYDGDEEKARLKQSQAYFMVEDICH